MEHEKGKPGKPWRVTCLIVGVLLVIVCAVCLILGGGLALVETVAPGQIVGLFYTPTPTPTATPTLTPTPTTGRLEGRLVEARLEEATGQRPPLSAALVVLCLKTSEHHCTIDAELNTRADDAAEFALESVAPGEYVLLYNPFPISNEDAYWDHWGGRELDFTDLSRFLETFFADNDDQFISIGSGPGGGIQAEFVGGQLVLTYVQGNTAIWSASNPLIVEFIEDEVPLTVEIIIGQTTEITIQTHAQYGM